MRKSLLSMMAVLFCGTAMAQDWVSELPVVTNDFTTYATAKIMVEPNTLTPYVGFKARQNVAAGTDYNKAMVYRFVDGAWQKVAESHDNVNGSYVDFAMSNTGRVYMSYANNDSTMKGLTVEQVIVGIDSCARLVNIPAAENVTYPSLALSGKTTNDAQTRLVTSYVGNTTAAKGGTYYRMTAVDIFDHKTGENTLQAGPSASTSSYKTASATSPNMKAYQMMMERGGTYKIHVYAYDGVSAWEDLGFPNGYTNSNGILYSLRVDAKETVYALTTNNSLDRTGQGKEYNVFVTRRDTASKAWTELPVTPVPANDSHVRGDFAVTADGTIVIAYIDYVDGKKVKMTTLAPNKEDWSTPVVIADTAGADQITVDALPNGDCYVAFVDETSHIKVLNCKANVYETDIFKGMVCDTITCNDLTMPASQGSVLQFTFAHENLGTAYHGCLYKYTLKRLDTFAGVNYRDTLVYGMSFYQCGKERDNSRSGLVLTNNGGRKVGAVRLNYVVIASKINKDLMNVYGKETPYENSKDLVSAEAAVAGTQITQLGQPAVGVAEYVFETPQSYVGFNTTTGLFVRDIIIGYVIPTGIETVAAEASRLEGGVVYDLQGIRREDNALSTGLYIRSNGSKADKYIVR